MELRCEDEEDPEMDAYVVLLLRKLRSARVRAVQAECGDTKELARGWRAQIVDDEEDPEMDAYVVYYCGSCAQREFGQSKPRHGEQDR